MMSTTPDFSAALSTGRTICGPSSAAPARMAVATRSAKGTIRRRRAGQENKTGGRGSGSVLRVSPERAKAKNRLQSPANANERSVNLCKVCNTSHPHIDRQFRSKQCNHALNAGAAESTEAPQVRTPDSDSRSTQSQRLEHIRSAAESAINQ